MAFRYFLLDPLQDAHWNEWILESGQGSVFFSAEWARVLAATYAYKPVYVTLYSGNRLAAMAPVMDVRSWLTPRRGVSLPFSDYCDPILAHAREGEHLLDVLMDFGRASGWRSLELRGTAPLPIGAPPSISYLGHELTLVPDETVLWAGLSGPTRRNIRKAIDEGLEVEMSQGLEAVAEFYRLNCATRRRHGLPPQPWRFFRNLHAFALQRKAGWVVTAKSRGTAVASAVFLHFGRRAHYKYGASDYRRQDLRGNNLVMWEAIRWYAAQGFASLCFGRTEPGNEGLRRFKRGWGTRERAIPYHRYDFRKGAFVPVADASAGRWSGALFSRLPIPLLRRIGELLYRHAA